MNAIEIYERASWQLERGQISIGQFDEAVAVLKDVEPVVRCKDCVCSLRLRDQLVCARISGGMDGYLYGSSDVVKPEDYCSFGIRQRAMPLDAKTDGA